jgi:hypothetical protein
MACHVQGFATKFEDVKVWHPSPGDVDGGREWKAWLIAGPNIAEGFPFRNNDRVTWGPECQNLFFGLPISQNHGMILPQMIMLLIGARTARQAG